RPQLRPAWLILRWGSSQHLCAAGASALLNLTDASAVVRPGARLGTSHDAAGEAGPSPALTRNGRPPTQGGEPDHPAAELDSTTPAEDCGPESGRRRSAVSGRSGHRPDRRSRPRCAPPTPGSYA